MGDSNDDGCRFSYHPYLALVYFIDQSDEFRLGEWDLAGRFDQDQQAVAEAAESYREHLIGDYGDPSGLFRVLSLRSFGHTDTIAISVPEVQRCRFAPPWSYYLGPQ